MLWGPHLISLAGQAAVTATISHQVKQGLLNDSRALLVLLILHAHD